MLMKVPTQIKGAILLFLLVVTTIYAKSMYSWKSGATTVTLSRDGTLRVKGKGAMENYGFMSPSNEPIGLIPPWYGVRTSITGLVIEDGVTTIGERAFTCCPLLNYVIIGNNVMSIGDMAFSSSSTTITSIEVAADNAHYCSMDGVLFNNDKTAIMLYPQGRQGAYMIPNSVKTIEKRAFSYCVGLTDITIHNSVEVIEKSTFFGCIGLTSVTIPNSVWNIMEYAFARCVGLTSITIPKNVTVIEKNVFVGCEKQMSIDVDADNERYCSLDGVLFNKDKTTLIHYPSGKHGSYKILGSVTSIGEYAFRECVGLTSVTIHNGVTSVGNSAFMGCTGLTSVIIPNSVTTVGVGIFSGCASLMSIIVKNTTPPQICNKCNTNKIIFKFTFPDYKNTDASNACLYVPESSIEAYRVAEEWNEYNCVNAIIPDEPIAEDKTVDGITTSMNRRVWFTISISATLILSVALFVTIKKPHKSSDHN
jgi:hypothetical protein